ncbi:unnamed protein product [Camellia sinensis]
MGSITVIHTNTHIHTQLQLGFLFLAFLSSTTTMEYDQENQSHPPIPKPSSGEGKLCIKLKIPSFEEGVVVVDHDQTGRSQKNDQPRVCNVCNKWFSSGKALGGHMRVHVQPNKELSVKKLKPKKIHRQELLDLPEKTDTDNAIDSPTCSLCGKNFPSMKSLFGHMRCHPEREWRGIQPPPPPAAAKNSSSSSSLSNFATTSEPRKVFDDEIDLDGAMAIPIREIDLTKALPGWSVKARRGRRSLTASAVVRPTLEEEEEEEEKLQDAVQDLMMLAHGDSLDSEPSGLTHNKHRVDVSEATNSNSLTNKAEIEDMNCVLESKNSPMKPRIDSPRPVVRYPVKKLRIDERRPIDGGSNSNGMLVKILNKGKRKAVFEAKYDPGKTVGLGHEWVNVDWLGQEDDESDCKTSDGNTKPLMMMKSKKRRKKLKLRDLESVQDAAPADQVSIPIETATPPPPPPPSDKYKCSTCDKCFPTHQALGGHRSSHNKVKNSLTIDEPLDDQYQYPPDAPNPIGQVDETKVEEGGGSSSKVAVAVAEIPNHQCKICGKIFSTGQALGGHQRCHWYGTTSPAEAPQPCQATSPGEASETGRKFLGFDLNELPSIEDEEDGVEFGGQAGGYDYASSSHNSAEHGF